MKKQFVTMCLVSTSAFAFAQEVAKVQGQITSASDQQPLIGVAVMLEGSTIGTITDMDGNFTLDVPSDGNLKVSYVGYKTQVIAINGQKNLQIVMQEDLTDLDEVVVGGYGVQKKALVTGANANIKGDAISKLNTNSSMEALQGTVPGLNITRNNGAPGAGTKVTIRGMGTIGNSSPLFIVDGVAVQNIDYLSPTDIEAIDVLKDAASAAIYGSRAANGVVLVTTKKGKMSDGSGMSTSVSYDAYVGIQNTYKELPVLNAQEYMAIIDEARTNDGSALFDWEAMLKSNTVMDKDFPGMGTQYGEEIWERLQNGWQGTNFVDEISKDDAIVHSHTLNLRGSSRDFNYNAGFTYFNQDGIIGGDIIDARYERLTARLNSEIVLFKKGNRKVLTFGENLTYTKTENKGVGTGNIYDNTLHDALVTSPLMPAYWDQPTINAWTGGYGLNLDGFDIDQINPLAKLYFGRNNNDNHNNSVIGNAYAILEPIKNLKIRSSFGLNAWFGANRSAAPTYKLGNKLYNVNSSVTQNAYIGSEYTWTNTATYDITLHDKHAITALIGTEMLKYNYNFNVGGMKQNLMYDSFNNAYLDNTYLPTEVGEIGTWGRDSSAGGGGLMSYMARLSYNYMSKYMLDATFRADGSSNFMKGNRWGYFPSVSAGWNFTEEDFMKDNPVFSSGKLRASWGQNGNQNIANFVYSSNIQYKDQGYYFGSGKDIPSMGAVPANIANPDVTWERSEQINIGADLRFLDNRLGVTLDWYNKMTKDWLVQAPIQGTSGAAAPFINGGDVRNRGVEALISWNDNVSDFTYGATFTFAYNKNEVTRLANAEGIINGSMHVISQGTSFVSRVEVGQPIGYFYGFETDGILQNQAEVDAYVDADGNPIRIMGEEAIARRPGDVRFVDQNGDGVVNDEDKVNIGNPQPLYELGLQLNVGYKGFYANMTMTGKLGMEVIQSYRSFADKKTQNYTTQIFERWHGEGTSNTMPRLSYMGNANTNLISDMYVHNANYLRISNIAVGYNFDDLIENLKFVKGASVYVSVNNLYTFTKYDGMNPEVGYGGADSWASGIDLGLYPQPRTVNFGCNITF